MTGTFTDTFNRDDIRRAYASFAADYKIVAEWTGLHSSKIIDLATTGIKALAVEQYLSAVHLQLCAADGAVREAAVYRVTTSASLWSADLPGDLYWEAKTGDSLKVIVYYNSTWWALTPAQRDAFSAVHTPGWGTSNFDGNYGGLLAVADKRFASRAYGIERTRYRS